MALNRSQIGCADHFGHVGQALQHFFDAVLPQGEHAGRQRRVPDVRGGGSAADVLADGIVADHQLMDAQPSAVTVVLALLATYRAPQLHGTRGVAMLFAPACHLRRARLGRIAGAAGKVLRGQIVQGFLVGQPGLAAGGAQAPHQALGKNGQQRVREVERVQPDFEQPRNALGCRIGVQRGQHQVPRERGFDGDARGFPRRAFHRS